MMSTPQTHPALNTIVSELAVLPEVSRVILFGSRARGDGGPYADIDLAIALTTDNAPADPVVWDHITAIVDSAPTLLQIDCVHASTLSPAFQRRIQQEGVVLFQR